MRANERDKKYKQIMNLAEWVNEHRYEVAADGMSIVIGISDKDTMKRMCMTGKIMPLYTMLELFRSKMPEVMDEQINAEVN